MGGTRQLDWDSDFFGISIARIDCDGQATSELKEELHRLRECGCRLVYWFGPETGSPTDAELASLGGTVVDRRTLYSQDLRGRDLSRGKSDAEVEILEQATITPNLLQLGVAAGRYSRFRIDPRFGEERYQKLYQRWIRACVEGELADAVLVTRDEGRERGLVTVKCSEGEGSIGLIVVEESARGRRLGTALVGAALDYFASRGCERARVVTQGANHPACRMFEASGFAVETVERVCHFWL